MSARRRLGGPDESDEAECAEGPETVFVPRPRARERLAPFFRFGTSAPAAGCHNVRSDSVTVKTSYRTSTARTPSHAPWCSAVGVSSRGRAEGRAPFSLLRGMRAASRYWCRSLRSLSLLSSSSPKKIESEPVVSPSSAQDPFIFEDPFIFAECSYWRLMERGRAQLHRAQPRKDRSCNALEVMNCVLIMTVNTIAYRSAHVTRHLMRASEE